MGVVGAGVTVGVDHGAWETSTGGEICPPIVVGGASLNINFFVSMVV